MLYNPEEIAPTVAAEHIPQNVLRFTSDLRPLGEATMRMETAFRQQSTSDLELAEHQLRDIVANTSEEPVIRFQASGYLATMAISEARTLGRQPDKSQVADAEFKTSGVLRDISMTVKSLKRTGNPLHEAQCSKLIGQASKTTCMLSNLRTSALTKTPPIHFSSQREHRPHDPQVRMWFGLDTHSFHEFNPDDPSNRVRLDIRTNPSGDEEKGRTAAQFLVLPAAHKAVERVSKQLGRRLTRPSFGNLIDIMLADPNDPPADFPNAVAIRNQFACQLRDTIASARLDDTMSSRQ